MSGYSGAAPVATSIQAYLDDALSPEQEQELRCWLADNPEHLDEFVRQLHFELALWDWHAAGMPAALAAAPAPSGWAALTRRTVILPLAVAASIAMAIGAWWWFGQRESAAGLGLTVVAVAGDARRLAAAGKDPGAGTGNPLVVGLGLRQGDRVNVAAGDQVTLQYAGERTRIELHGATATFGLADGGKRIALAAGRLTATVAPQEKPFRCTTPHAVTEVVGTRFRLEVAPATTTLVVDEGSVALLEDGRRRMVNPGQQASARRTATGLAITIAPAGTASPRDPSILDDFDELAADLWVDCANAESSLRHRFVAPGAGSRGHALRIDYQLADPAGPITKDWGSGRWGAAVIRPAAAPVDWSAYTGIALQWLGRGTGQTVFLEIRDNGRPGVPGDTWERFVFEIRDDRRGWREVRAPWAAFGRYPQQPPQVPDDGLNLREVHSLAFVVYGHQGWFVFDDLRLLAEPQPGAPGTPTQGEPR